MIGMSQFNARDRPIGIVRDRKSPEAQMSQPMIPTKQRSYLLLMHAGVIACDLTQIIHSFDADACVTLVQTTDAALAYVNDIDALALAVLSLGPEKVVAAGLDSAIRAKGGVAHLIGDEADMQTGDETWSVIDRPFSTENIFALLIATQARRTQGM
jgi:hypothetical protein